MSFLVSIIVPVYNIEPYIANCLDSLLSQTHENIEILCIDDGSSDNSKKVILSCAQKDGRVKYFYQQNAGVSAARNKGLCEASGDFVFFVDGDDYIHPQTIEISLRCAEEANADMVCSHYIITSSTNEKFEHVSDYGYIEADFTYLFKKDDTLGKCSVSKLIRKSVTENIRFPEGVSYGEDGAYIIKLMNENIRAVILDKTFYFYFKREFSATTSALDERRMTILYAYDGLCDYLESSENSEIKGYCLRAVFYNIHTRRILYKHSQYEKLVETECRRIGKKHLKRFIREKSIPFAARILHALFFKFPVLYSIFKKLK